MYSILRPELLRHGMLPRGTGERDLRVLPTGIRLGRRWVLFPGSGAFVQPRKVRRVHVPWGKN